MRMRITKLVRVLMAALIALGALSLSACGEEPPKSEDDSLRQYAAQFAAQYQVVSQEGTHATVSVTAPDFSAIAAALSSEENQASADAEKIIAYANDHPDCKKEYLLEVDALTAQAVEKALLDKIVYELMTAAISGLTYTERWDTE